MAPVTASVMVRRPCIRTLKDTVFPSTLPVSAEEPRGFETCRSAWNHLAGSELGLAVSHPGPAMRVARLRRCFGR
jgi:hypothetical protein